MDILVTGGAGYIGSHTVIELVAAGFNPIIVDNFSNSKPESLLRVAELCDQSISHYPVDILDREALEGVFKHHDIKAVIHFAGLKAVGESVAQPLRYYQNNVAGTMVLAEVMQAQGVEHLIFSSSATVYGDPEQLPIDESAPTSTTNPYGASKLMVENIMRDLCAAPDSNWRCCLLRYFNPVGAHESGRIGEDPNGIPNNLLPYVAQVAVGKLERLQVFGNDYDTIDGTGVRDYIHVVDLAMGHVAALSFLLQQDPACHTFNLGTGQGYSVLQILDAFALASATPVPYKIVPRRPGDVAACYADASKAERELGWKAKLGLGRMMADTWRWQSQNPNGFD